MKGWFSEIGQLRVRLHRHLGRPRLSALSGDQGGGRCAQSRGHDQVRGGFAFSGFSMAGKSLETRRKVKSGPVIGRKYHCE